MGVVPSIPPVIVGSGSEQGIRAAAPVVGNGQWREMADLSNWLKGRGAQLVAGNPHIEFHTAEGNGGPAFGGIPNGTLRAHIAYAWPRSAFGYRVWLVALGAVEPGRVYGQFMNATAETIGTFDFYNTAQRVVPIKTFRILEPYTPATGAAELLINNEALSDTYVIVYGFCCFEVPLVANSTIPDEQTLNTKSPIFEETSNLESLDMVAESADAVDTHATRASLFSWYSRESVTITATTFTGTGNVFRVQPTVIPRHLHSGVTTTTVNWATYAQGNGGTAMIRATMTSGHVTTVTITATSFAFTTGASTVRTEDPTRWSVDGGIRTGARDFATIEVCRLTATSVEVRGFYMGEG